MFLAVDIGNSNIVIALFNDGKWQYVERYLTKSEQPSLYYELKMRDTLLEWGVNPVDISNCGISSVVPDLNDKMSQAIYNHTGKLPVLLRPEIFVKMDIDIPKVYEIGSDLVANAYAVAKNYKTNTIIVDFGTALTFTVYQHGRGIIGVTITPGLKTAIQTLSGNTAMLPQVELMLPHSVIGYSTATAINAGVLYGYIGLVREILSRMKKELKVPYKVVATGGLSSILKELKDDFDDINKALTLDGIRFIALEHG